MEEMVKKNEERIEDMIKKQKEKDEQSKKAQEALEDKVQELLTKLAKLSSGAQNQIWWFLNKGGIYQDRPIVSQKEHGESRIPAQYMSRRGPQS